MKPTLAKEHKDIKGQYHDMKDWTIDPKGYFLIRINRKKKEIEVGFCKKDNVIEVLISGKRPQDIYFEAHKEHLFTNFDHAAYLGKELEKAFLALKYGLAYVQDEELDLNKKFEDN
ncbi:DUF4346 domain-containing protein [Candidatus Woesearchaeota archaeon]|nr:DUF4346 domain-containing protein [Candidatus Woesearchaeota archaeon]